MAWSFRASDSAFVEESATSLTVTKPSGVVEDDLMVAFLNKDFNTDIGTPPSGWTEVENITDGDQRHIMWYKVAGASEAADYTWSWTGGADCVGMIIAWSGVDTADPFDVSSQFDSVGIIHTATSITTTNDNALLVAAYGTDVGAATAITWTAPSGMTEREDISTAVDIWASGSIHDEEFGDAGSTGVRDASASAFSNFGSILAAFNISTGPPFLPYFAQGQTQRNTLLRM